jgi:hypothetical protein
VVRHGEIQAEQIHDRLQHAFGLALRTTERQPQLGPDDGVRVVPQPASLSGRRRRPRGDRLGPNPERQAAPP